MAVRAVSRKIKRIMFRKQETEEIGRTIGVIVGAAVGALHGKENIPENWIQNLSGRTAADDDGRIFDLLRQSRQIWG